MSKIELTHIDKYYGKNHVLKDLNLTIEDRRRACALRV